MDSISGVGSKCVFPTTLHKQVSDHVERTAPRFRGLYEIGRGLVRVGVICARGFVRVGVICAQ